MISWTGLVDPATNPETNGETNQPGDNGYTVLREGEMTRVEDSRRRL